MFKIGDRVKIKNLNISAIIVNINPPINFPSDLLCIEKGNGQREWHYDINIIFDYKYYRKLKLERIYNNEK